MKKITIFSVLLAALSGYASAQQKRSENYIQHQVIPIDSLFKVQPKQPLAATRADGLIEVPYTSRMPVAKTNPRDSNMPVVVPGDPNTHYTILVKKIAMPSDTSRRKPSNP